MAGNCVVWGGMQGQLPPLKNVANIVIEKCNETSEHAWVYLDIFNFTPSPLFYFYSPL